MCFVQLYYAQTKCTTLLFFIFKSFQQFCHCSMNVKTAEIAERREITKWYISFEQTVHANDDFFFIFFFLSY